MRWAAMGHPGSFSGVTMEGARKAPLNQKLKKEATLKLEQPFNRVI